MSFEGSNEKLTSSSESNVSMSKNNNSYTTSTTANRISPPPTQLTINQFQPIFKEARKKKQQPNNTKTNDDRKSFSDQTLFKTKYDNSSPTEYIFSERYPSKFKGGENHYVCSSAYSDGYIMCRSLDHQQSNNFIENENNAYVDTIDNLSYGDQCSSGGRDNIYKEIYDESKLNLLIAQSSRDSSNVEGFINPPSPSYNNDESKEVVSPNPSLNTTNLLSEDKKLQYKETVVCLQDLDEKEAHPITTVSTSVVTDNCSSGFGSRLLLGYSPSRQPLLSNQEMNCDEENDLSSGNNSIKLTRSTTWTANNTKRMPQFGQAILRSSLKMKSTGELSVPGDQDSIRNTTSVRSIAVRNSRKVQFDKDDDVLANSISDEKNPER